MKVVTLTTVLICFFSLSGVCQTFHTDIRGTNDDSDGGMFQLATPSANHYLRLFSGRVGDSKPYLYFNDQDTFRIASGVSDFTNFKSNLTILNGISPVATRTTFVGINNSAPVAELDILSSDADDGAEIRISNADQSHFLRLFSGRQNDFPFPSIYWKDGDSLSLGTSANGYTERMRITSEGLVGIGTDKPSATLHATSMNTYGGYFLNSAKTEPDLVIGGTGNGNPFDDGIISSDPQYFSSDLILKSNDNIVIALDVTDSQDGRFEIKRGDGSIIYELHEGGNSFLSSNLPNDYGRIRIKNIDNGNFWDIAGGGFNNTELNFFSPLNGNILSLRDNGRTGVNQISPIAALHVTPIQGDDAARFDGKVNFTDPLLLNGSIGTAGQVLTSNGNNDPLWTTPSPANPQVGFKAHLTADVAVSTLTEVTLASFTEDYDDGGNFNHATGVFTAPSDGVYHFECMFSWTIGGVTQTNIPVMIRIKKNSALEEQFAQRVTIFTLIKEDQHYSTDLKLANGDQISFIAYQIGGSSMFIYGSGGVEDTKVSGYRVY